MSTQIMSRTQRVNEIKNRRTDQMQVLIITSEKRADFHHVPSIVGYALKELGAAVTIWRSGFLEQAAQLSGNPNFIKLPRSLNRFDVIIGCNSDKIILDYARIGKNTKKIQLYYEDYDLPVLIPNHDELWTSKSLLPDLALTNLFKHPKELVFGITNPMVIPELECWKPAEEKNIAFRYNGALRLPDPFIPRNFWMQDRIRFCNELKRKVLRFELPHFEENHDLWLDKFARTWCNLHISQFSTGQGMFESGLLECLTIEYVFKDLMKIQVIDGKHCFLVETTEEAIKAFEIYIDMDTHHRNLMLNANKELASKHSWKILIPKLKERLNL